MGLASRTIFLIPALLLVQLLPLQLAQAGSWALEGGKVSLAEPKGWQQAQGMFGVPLAFFGPAGPDAVSRPVLMVLPSGFDGIEIDGRSLARDYESWKAGRREYARKISAESVDFEPYRELPLESGGKAHVAAWRYRLGSEKFTETSAWISCAGRLYVLKTLLPAGGRSPASDAGGALESALRSFSCQ
jgi:hypothetical protein